MRDSVCKWRGRRRSFKLMRLFSHQLVSPEPVVRQCRISSECVGYLTSCNWFSCLEQAPHICSSLTNPTSCAAGVSTSPEISRDRATAAARELTGTTIWRSFLHFFMLTWKWRHSMALDANFHSPISTECSNWHLPPLPAQPGTWRPTTYNFDMRTEKPSENLGQINMRLLRSHQKSRVALH